MKPERWLARLACLLAAMSLPLAAPAHAQTTVVEAEALRKLDIMLMVSALVCRSSKDNFQAEYERFSARHMPALRAAHRVLHNDLARVHGEEKAKRLLDNLSVRMANTYGSGHPWLACGQLKATTAELANRVPGQGLHESATYLLAAAPANGGTMLAAR